MKNVDDTISWVIQLNFLILILYYNTHYLFLGSSWDVRFVLELPYIFYQIILREQKINYKNIHSH